MDTDPDDAGAVYEAAVLDPPEDVTVGEYSVRTGY